MELVGRELGILRVWGISSAILALHVLLSSSITLNQKEESAQADSQEISSHLAEGFEIDVHEKIAASKVSKVFY